MVIDFIFITQELLEEFNEYKRDLMRESGYSRNQALCEAYHSLSLNWRDVLQQATTQEEADYINNEIERYENLSDTYCDKE